MRAAEWAENGEEPGNSECGDGRTRVACEGFVDQCAAQHGRERYYFEASNGNRIFAVRSFSECK